MYKQTLICPILSRREVAPRQTEFVLKSAALASEAKPGQFIHINVESAKHLLRRPISICDVEKDTVRIIFEIKGEGTHLLNQKQAGDTLDVIGPLGRGFDIKEGRAFVIGGGIGVFPLFMLCRTLDKPEIFLGFRTKAQIALEEEFAALGSLHIATDDGTYGHSGFAIDIMRDFPDKADVIYACGPAPMLKAVAAMAAERSIPAQISMEQRMGCGIGACLCCVCRTKDGYSKVCQSGPVFNADEVIFE